MILVSCAAFVIQTLPEYMAQDEGETNAWGIIERACIAVFSLEFGLRLGSCPDRWRFVRQPLNLIDFAAIVPFYIELVVGASTGGGAVIRIIRLVRIFRIFKISRYLPWMRVFSNALVLSLAPLVMLVLVVMLAVVIFSSVMYYAERGEWDEEQGERACERSCARARARAGIARVRGDGAAPVASRSSCARTCRLAPLPSLSSPRSLPPAAPIPSSAPQAAGCA